MAQVEAPASTPPKKAASPASPAVETAASTPAREKTSPKPLPATDKNLSIQKALEYWGQVHPQHPGRLIAYLYRLWPIIDRPPRERAIATWVEPVTYRQILQEHGAGEYKLHLNDKDKGKGSELIVSRWKFDEHFSDCPPVIEPHDLDRSSKDNQSYIRWLDSRGMGMHPQQGTADPAIASLAQTLTTAFTKLLDQQTRSSGAPNLESQAFSKSLDLVTSTMTKQVESILSQTKAEDPDKFMRMLSQAKAMFGPVETKSGSSTMEAFLLQQLDRMTERNNKLMDRLLEQRNTPPPQDQLTAVLLPKLIEKFVDSLDGNANGPQLSGKWGWLQMLTPQIDKALDTLTVWGKAAPFLSRQRPQQPGHGAHQLPAAENPEPAAAAPEPAQPPPPQETPMEQLGEFLKQVWIPMTTFITRGQTGEEFADFLVEGGHLNVAIHDQIKDLGRDNILSQIKAHGEAALKAQGITMERFTKFFDQFLGWTPPGPDDEPIDGPVHQAGPTRVK